MSESQAVLSGHEALAAVNGSQSGLWREAGLRPCGCGCGVLVSQEHRRVYLDAEHRLRAWARRQAAQSSQRALPGESRVERAFAEWSASEDGQAVKGEVIRRAMLLRNRGVKRWGIASLWESIRYDHAVCLVGTRDGYLLNNSYRSLLARRVMAEVPELAGFFEVRQLRGVR